VRKSLEAWDNERAQYGECDSFQIMSMLFTTYPNNVPDATEYTVEDMVNLANDPTLLELYEEPFHITHGYHMNRPALYVHPHAACDLAGYLEQPNEMDNQTVVIRADGVVHVIDIKEVIASCALPDKYVYGCIKCLGTHAPIDNACVIRRTVGANNPYYQNEYADENSTLAVTDFRKVKSWGKYESPFKSQRTQIAGHLYVSPVMFYEDSDRSSYYGRKNNNAFVGFRKINSENLNFSTYEEHLKSKLEAVNTRRKHAANIKEHCTTCSVKETCHNIFPHKKKYCTDTLPPPEEIDRYFISQEENVSKPLLIDILLGSGLQTVENPESGRKIDAYVGVNDNHGGLGYRVMSRSRGRIVAHGTSLEDWEEFKKTNNINTSYSDLTRKELTERMDNPAFFAKFLACASIKESPRMVSAFHSTTYEKAFIDIRYGRLELKFRYPSRRSICPWSYDVVNWSDLFTHYGRIPGFK
jgi:hypothetical protein